MEITAKKYLVMVACALSSVLGAHAQSIDEIKNSKDYVWGEGTGVTSDQAERDAQGALSRRIAVSIFNMSIETGKNGNSDQENMLQSISAVMLQNVQVRILSEEPDAKVFCFVHRNEVAKMYKLRAEKIADFVDAGKLAESRLQIDDALRYYYWALLLAKTSPEPVKVEFGDQKGMAISLLPIKIKSVLHKIKGQIREGKKDGNRITALVTFTYDEKPVSSLQFNYNDGQGIVGPIYAKDGVGEIELVSEPGSGKVHLTYETIYRKMVDNLDVDLCGIYNTRGFLPKFDASVDLPIKIKKGSDVQEGAAVAVEASAGTAEADIAPEVAKQKKPIAMHQAPNTAQLEKAVQMVEDAITTANPQHAYSAFTPQGYELFKTLMNETGKISLAGNKQEHTYIETDGYLLGRSTRIKIKFKSGRSFIENLVYRFNASSGLIESVAFGLTKQAENDIMNAATSWPEVSRWAILNFMEDYQTAFALKRTDYIRSIFSNDAIIITGTVVNKTESDQVFDQNKVVDFGNKSKVMYSKHTKEEYIERLQRIFDQREYVHLTFEDNVTRLINLPSIVSEGACFGIEIKQRYTSSGYSDVGYLTLVFDTRGEKPIIHVRLWQPDKTEMVSLPDFIKMFTN